MASQQRRFILIDRPCAEAVWSRSLLLPESDRVLLASGDVLHELENIPEELRERWLKQLQLPGLDERHLIVTPSDQVQRTGSQPRVMVPGWTREPEIKHVQAAKSVLPIATPETNLNIDAAPTAPNHREDGYDSLRAGTFYEVSRRLLRLLGNRTPSQDSIRFAAESKPNFPHVELAGIEVGEQPRVTSTRLGLSRIGLPTRWSDAICSQQADGGRSAVQDFLDLLFHHRLLSLRFQAWQQTRMAQMFEAARLPGETAGDLDPTSQLLRELLGQPQLQHVPEDALLYYVGLLTLAPRSTAALQRMVADYFEQPVTIATSTDDRSAPRVTLRIGPMPLASYSEFLPTGSALAPLDELCRTVLGEHIAVIVEPILCRSDVPPLVLQDACHPEALKLGWTTWFGSPDDGDGPDASTQIARDDFSPRNSATEGNR